jgi:hypothetical protein
MAEELSERGGQALENVMKQLEHLPSFDDFIMLRRPNYEIVVFEVQAFDEEALELAQNHVVTVTYFDKTASLAGQSRLDSAAISKCRASSPE